LQQRSATIKAAPSYRCRGRLGVAQSMSVQVQDEMIKGKTPE